MYELDRLLEEIIDEKLVQAVLSNSLPDTARRKTTAKMALLSSAGLATIFSVVSRVSRHFAHAHSPGILSAPALRSAFPPPLFAGAAATAAAAVVD